MKKYIRLAILFSMFTMTYIESNINYGSITKTLRQSLNLARNNQKQSTQMATALVGSVLFGYTAISMPNMYQECQINDKDPRMHHLPAFCATKIVTPFFGTIASLFNALPLEILSERLSDCSAELSCITTAALCSIASFYLAKYGLNKWRILRNKIHDLSTKKISQITNNQCKTI